MLYEVITRRRIPRGPGVVRMNHEKDQTALRILASRVVEKDLKQGFIKYPPKTRRRIFSPSRRPYPGFKGHGAGEVQRRIIAQIHICSAGEADRAVFIPAADAAARNNFV